MKLLNEDNSSEAKSIPTLLNSYIEECKKKDFADVVALVKKCQDDITNAVRQFDSTVMIVVAVGMLKAGKSTLINLLARDETASPTGYGTDTTLRPALITMGDVNDTEGSIIIYGDRPVSLTEQRQGLQTILDTLRGLPLNNAVEQPRVEPLRPDTLKKTLCQPSGVSNALLPHEPLLVVVKIPYHADGKMLQNGRMLLDMPGLDSANAEISLRPEKVFSDAQMNLIEQFLSNKIADKNHAAELAAALREQEKAVTYETLIGQCDMVLCLQSSVSPLNEKACSCLNSVLDMRSEATAWVVMNRMRNQAWLTDECMDAKWEEQVHNANKVFAKIKQGANLNQSTCNLGEAYAGILENDHNIRVPEGSSVQQQKAMLLEQSGFLPLEQMLLNHLEQNGRTTRLKFCKQNLIQQLNTLKTRLGTLKQTVESRKKADEEAITAWENAEKKLATGESQILLNGHTDCNMKSLRDIIRNRCTALENNRESMKKKNIPGDKLDDYLAECSRQGKALTMNFLKNLKVNQIQLKQTGTNGVETSRCVGDIIGQEVSSRCMNVCKNALDCVKEVQNGAEAESLDATRFQPMCDQSILLNDGFNIDEYNMPMLYAETTENRPLYRPFWGPGRIVRASGIWQQDIDKMIDHYCAHASDIIQDAVVGQNGDTRTSVIICSLVDSSLENFKKSIVTEREKTVRQKETKEKEIKQLSDMIVQLDEKMNMVHAW